MLTIFTALCAPMMLALLGWGGSYISDIARAGQQRDKDQAVFMARIDARFDAVVARTDALSADMRNGFEEVKKKQEQAELNSKEVERRVTALERQVQELTIIFNLRGMSPNSPPQTQKRP